MGVLSKLAKIFGGTEPSEDVQIKELLNQAKALGVYLTEENRRYLHNLEDNLGELHKSNLESNKLMHLQYLVSGLHHFVIPLMECTEYKRGSLDLSDDEKTALIAAGWSKESVDDPQKTIKSQARGYSLESFREELARYRLQKELAEKQGSRGPIFDPEARANQIVSKMYEDIIGEDKKQYPTVSDAYGHNMVQNVKNALYKIINTNVEEGLSEDRKRSLKTYLMGLQSYVYHIENQNNKMLELSAKALEVPQEDMRRLLDMVEESNWSVEDIPLAIVTMIKSSNETTAQREKQPGNEPS